MTRFPILRPLRLAAVALLGATLPAVAHDGFHPHPHGLSAGVIAAAVIGMVLGYALPLLRGRA